jgi:hypothetical protein
MALFLLATPLMLLASLLQFCWMMLMAPTASPQLLVPASRLERLQHECTCLQHMTAA